MIPRPAFRDRARPRGHSTYAASARALIARHNSSSRVDASGHRTSTDAPGTDSQQNKRLAQRRVSHRQALRKSRQTRLRSALLSSSTSPSVPRGRCCSPIMKRKPRPTGLYAMSASRSTIARFPVLPAAFAAAVRRVLRRVSLVEPRRTVPVLRTKDECVAETRSALGRRSAAIFCRAARSAPSLR